MEYIEVEEAVALPGLRLVLTAGVPGPWGEAAKGVLHVKGIEYTPVRQVAGGPNETLMRWTRQSSAPVAMYADERPRSGWAEILFLAERLEPSPRLVPADPSERAQMLGLCHEICGEHGLGWTRRLTLMGGDDAAQRGSMAWKYGIGEADAVAASVARVNQLLALLADQLRTQREAGRQYFLGETLSALDIYWAAFSNLIEPLPHEKSPMPDFLRKIYDYSSAQGSAAADPLLIEHRDFVFERHLTLPQDF